MRIVLADDNRTRLSQQLDAAGVPIGDVVPERFGATGRAQPPGLDHVLHTKWDPVQWSAGTLGPQLLLQGVGLASQVILVGERDEAVQRAVGFDNGPERLVEKLGDARIAFAESREGGCRWLHSRSP